MKTVITNLNFLFDNGFNHGVTGVSVNFSSNDSVDYTNLNGSIKITFEEYVSVMADMDALAQLVLNKVITKLNNLEE